MGTKDHAVKAYMRDAERFADAFNYAAYDGEQVIRAENLRPLDSVTTHTGENGVSLETVQRRHAAKMRERLPAGSGVWYQDDAGKWLQK